MYIWQWQFGEKYTVIGRTWDEFNDFRSQLKQHLPDEQYLCIYVHNLSYEFQFLRGIYHFDSDTVFALKKRKILKCEMDAAFEFRCSYIHSNMSLAEYTSKMGAEHSKITDEFDYSIRRFSFTPLSERELLYCQYDVLGLVEALQIEMSHDGDNLYTIPLTSTGYVRRDTKKAMKRVSHYTVSRILPDLHTYTLCREAFRGGDTHASRFYSNQIIRNVKSADRSSSYPDVICNNEFPISAFTHAGRITYNQLTDLINRRHKACLIRASFTNLRIKEIQPDPYISRDKSRLIQGGIFDNGRVLSADYLETTITDIDLKIILMIYDFDDLTPLDVCYARYGKLPQPIIDVNIMYYRAKTELKGVPGEEIFYMKSKNKLNSIYGMMAQDPVKQNIIVTDDGYYTEEGDIEEILAKSNRRAFLAYQWGVWVTAWARYMLQEAIQIVKEEAVYWDTDSVKHVGEADWTEYNIARVEASKASGAYATDPKGTTHYMGVLEDDGYYNSFKTMGAKKYAYNLIEGGKTHVTISGVGKRLGGVELDLFYGGLEGFREGTVFSLAGGTESVYNDVPEFAEWNENGTILPITSNVVIRDSTYTLGVTDEYRKIIEDYQIIVDNML